MLTRRRLLGGIGSAFALALPRALSAQTADEQFSSLLSSIKGKWQALANARTEREGLIDYYDQVVTKAVAPRRAPSTRSISVDATNLIVTFEVTSATRYEKKYRRPIWPHGQSGVTVGIGYDLGYVTKAWLAEDWKEFLSAEHLETLTAACGLKGAKAQAALPTFSSVDIAWITADQQFRKNVLPRWIAETLGRLPNSSELSDDSLGALVSLVYNRGASFGRQGERYKEMRAIYEHMDNQEFEKIPAQIESMTRIWKGKANMEGLITRRQLEALLFKKGLSQ